MITRLSTGPQHHFFGYYGICPWDSTDRYHLALRTDFHERAPTPEDRAEVGLIDANSGRFTPFAATRAFNLQQGSMMHWIDAGFGEEFTFNDWEGDRLVSRAVDPRTRVQRTIDGAIAAVSPFGSLAIGPNYARMSVCRRVVGYANRSYSLEDLTPIPDDDGLFRIDLQTGRTELLIAISDVHRLLPYQGIDQQPHWFNHAVFNPDGTRLVFFCRVMQPGRFLDSLWTVNTDGTGLGCLIEYGHFVSHLAWYDLDTIMVSCDVLGSMQFVSLNVRSGQIAGMQMAEFPPDGHNAFSPDYRWVVCDTYPKGPDRECGLLLHDRTTHQTHHLGSFVHPAHIRGAWRCDLHPRWSRGGRVITFDSVHEGTRQIYAVDVSGIV